MNLDPDLPFGIIVTHISVSFLTLIPNDALKEIWILNAGGHVGATGRTGFRELKASEATSWKLRRRRTSCAAG
jgi:hypothetical protein